MASKAILFDFVGVLMFPRPDYIPDARVDAIDAIIGKVTNDVDFQHTTQNDYQLSDSEFNDVLQQIAQKYQPFEELWALLPALHQDFRLAIINNGTFLTYPAFRERLPINDCFDVFVSSAREGVRKPDPAIYLRTCDYLGVQPHECLFMDDSPVNIAGAATLGMQTIHWPDRWNGLQQFQQWLEKH